MTKLNRVINQYDLNGNFIKEFKSAKEIQETLGIVAHHIGNCCLGYSKTSHGYIWKYASVDNKPEIIDGKMKIPLTKGKFAIIDETDWNLLKDFKWYYSHGYARADKMKNRIKTRYAMHRVILGITNLSIHVDHVDKNPLNNCRNNLRPCNMFENSRNVSSHKDSTSKYVGVCYAKQDKKWRSELMFNGKKVFSKTFDTEIEAAKARDEQAKIYHGKFANLNFPD